MKIALIELMQTHVFYCYRKKHIDMSIQDEVSMEYLNSQYILEKHTNINIANGKNRLDFEYHQLINDFQAIQQESNFPIIPLEEFAESCKRGRTLAKKRFDYR